MANKKIVLRRPPRRENPLKKGTAEAQRPTQTTKTKKKTTLAQQMVQRLTAKDKKRSKKPLDKKVFLIGGAVLLAVILLVVILLVGKNKEETQPETTGNTQGTTLPEEKKAIGTLVIAFGAHIEMQYDHEGNALTIQGMNDLGKKIVENCSGFEGRDAVFAVRAFLRYATTNQLLGNTKNMTVRVKNGDPLPTEDYLETIVQDTQYLADEDCTGIQVLRIDQEKLDANGLIDLDTVRKMATRFLGATMVADLGGDETPVDNIYTFDYEGKVCNVDAATGLVTLETT